MAGSVTEEAAVLLPLAVLVSGQSTSKGIKLGVRIANNVGFLSKVLSERIKTVSH